MYIYRLIFKQQTLDFCQILRFHFNYLSDYYFKTKVTFLSFRHLTFTRLKSAFIHDKMTQKSVLVFIGYFFFLW